MMLSILANSVAFRYAAHHFNHDTWVAFGASIGDNARSIEMFAKVRGLNWRTALTMEPHLGRPLTEAEIRSTLNVPTDHPHNFTLPLEGDPRRPQHQGHDQVNVDANIYNAKLLTSRPRPNSWPQGLPFPHDPTVRRAAAGNCFNCGSARICACRFDTSIAQPLVEIVAYPDRGNGIRALQAIPAGSIIGEYIGEINPIGSGQDPTYNLEFSTAEGTLCEIHCRRYGNWTRYMNHSCRATAFFDSCTVGNRATMCIRTVRDIDIFDEITIDYGSEYWQEAALCRCGEPACRYDTPKKVRAARALQVEKDELAFQARTEAARKKKRGE